ncbi:DinB family protein [Mucilaginibacter aquaedulcis]|uniref:DinB family protein n=1 Tax=Mucilaginibacter aquaedulcis TaxID=1187081 RepID=UPI0025B5DA73|nr:DinB family protein [Mucilaginibacter aquaedulcis]MDN3549595.1 DinB family protein [Mucilaginibacter aquaedulcis]
MIKRTYNIEFGQLRDHSVDYIQGILKDTRTTTILTMKNLSIHELNWQYKEGWNTIGALLSHIVAIDNLFRIEYIKGRKLTDEENTELTPAIYMGEYLPQLINQQPLEYYIAQLTSSGEQLLNALNNITHEDFTRRIEDYDEETGCNLAWVLYHKAEDEIYHRGQISMIRKLYKDNRN